MEFPRALIQRSTTLFDDSTSGGQHMGTKQRVSFSVLILESRSGTEGSSRADPHSISQQLPFPSCVPAVALFWERTLVLSYLPIQVQAQAASAPSLPCLLTVSVLVCLEAGLPLRGALVEPPPSMRASRLPVPDLRKRP